MNYKLATEMQVFFIFYFKKGWLLTLPRDRLFLNPLHLNMAYDPVFHALPGYGISGQRWTNLHWFDSESAS